MLKYVRFFTALIGTPFWFAVMLVLLFGGYLVNHNESARLDVIDMTLGWWKWLTFEYGVK